MLIEYFRQEYLETEVNDCSQDTEDDEEEEDEGEKEEEEKEEDEDNSVDKYERQVGQEGQPDLLIGRISQLYVDSLEPKGVQGTYKEVVEITRIKYIYNHC